MSAEDMYMCRNHNIPLLHRGDECPWCAFINQMSEALVKEYKRGFEDGVKAVEKEAKSAGDTVK